jgi:hypothetical protein
MPIFQPDLVFNLIFFTKVAILILLLFYVIFSLIIVRQVDLMARTLITPVSGIVSAISIVNAGFAFGFLLLAVGIL